MANFFEDNADLQFYLGAGADWAHLAEVTEYGWRAPGGFKNFEEAQAFYLDVAKSFGQLAAEYGGASDLSGTPPYFLHTDTLGSTRLTTDLNGNVVRRTDYWPFGQEINSLSQDAPYRTTAMGYNSALRNPPTLFTGKERDAETGLDYFGARYMSSAQGRFTSPDPLGASAKVSDPQTWNRYSYTLNNPLRYVDPDGLEVPDGCVKNQNCTIVVKVNVVYDQTVNRGRGLTAQQKQQFEKGQIAKAQKDYGNSNIKLDVTYTAGSYTVGTNGQPQLTGTQADALNVIASSGTPNGAAGVSGVDKSSGTAITFLNVNDVTDRNLYPFVTNTLSHELGHQLIGDVFQPLSNDVGGSFRYLGREAAVDSRVAGQAAGVSQQGFREGVAPRRYAAPLNPEASKPRQ